MSVNTATGIKTLTFVASKEFNNAQITVSKVDNPGNKINKKAYRYFEITPTNIDAETTISFNNAGICPACSGRLERSLHACDDHDPRESQPCPTCHRQYEIAARFVCSVCKAANICSAVKLVLLTDLPEVAEFLGGHDVVPEFPYGSETPGLSTDQSVESFDPLLIRMTLQIDDDQLHVFVDEEMVVTKVIEGDPIP